MYNSLYILIIIIPNISSNCRIHLRHHQPSIGQHLLRIENSIDNKQICEVKCSNDHLCSMVTYNRQYHRCHFFQTNPKRSISKSYQSNYLFSTYANCPENLSLFNTKQKQISIIHCNYDTLPWQQAQSSRSIVFKSYTLIGNSYLPCQELCSSVRYCAGVQFQVHGLNNNYCRLLHSTKSWDLLPSNTWTVYAKRTCHIQIHDNELLSQAMKPLCTFKYFGEGTYKQHNGIIHKFSNMPGIQCQYLCSKIINCIGIELIKKQSQCILLSPNILQNDGLINLKSHKQHHIYLKISCHSFPTHSI